MASSSKRPGKAANKSILTPVMTLEGHELRVVTLPDGSHREFKYVSDISYFPNGKQMISAAGDRTFRRWDLQEGKEIEEAREVCGNHIASIFAMGVSRDGRWVITVAGLELKVCEVETGIVRTFYDEDRIRCIDISADGTLLAGASMSFTDETMKSMYSMRIWSLDTGELVAGPFTFSNDFSLAPAFRFSEKLKKLAVLTGGGQCLGVWDVQGQTLDVTRGTLTKTYIARSSAPVFWTSKDKFIVAAFSFTDDPPMTIYEFDSLTLETVGDSFEGHTGRITDLALSFGCALLASASRDNTIKLWAFESRQLLASFDVQQSTALILSPDSNQVAFTAWDDTKIYICNIPPNILASVGIAETQPSTSKPERPRLVNILNSDATRRAMHRKPVILPVISPFPTSLQPPPTRNIHFLRFLRKLLPSSRKDAVRPIRTDSLRNPLDFPATAPLPRPHINLHEDSRPPPVLPTTQSWWPIRTGRTSRDIVDVPLAQGKERNASADAPAKDNEWIRDEDYVSPPPSPTPDSRQPPTTGQINTGEHGSGRLCFCF